MAEQKKRLSSIPELKAEFRGVLKQLTNRYSYSEVWADFAEIVAIVVHQSAFMNPVIEQAFEQGIVSEDHVEKLRAITMPRDERWQRLEDRYMTYVPKYGSEGLNLITQLYSITSQSVEGHRCDFLGPLYMELDLSGSEQRSKRGEFFTPPALSHMMAAMQMFDISEVLERQGYVTLQEPTCGAGGMPIAFAEELEKAGHDPREVLFVEAMDINRTFWNMCYIQLSMLDIPARLWCGDTLLLEFQEMRETPQLMLSRYHWEKNPVFHMFKFLRQLESHGLAEPAQASDSVEEDSSEAPMLMPTEPPPDAQVFDAGDDGQFRLF